MTNGTAITDAIRAAENEPISAEERQKAFLEAFAALEKRFGCTVTAQMRPRILGEVVQVEAAVVVVAIPDWKAD